VSDERPIPPLAASATSPRAAQSPQLQPVPPKPAPPSVIDRVRTYFHNLWSKKS
jgi:hypothetical protein